MSLLSFYLYALLARAIVTASKQDDVNDKLPYMQPLSLFHSVTTVTTERFLICSVMSI